MRTRRQLFEELHAAQPKSAAMLAYDRAVAHGRAQVWGTPEWEAAQDATQDAWEALTDAERRAVDDLARQVGYMIERTV